MVEERYRIIDADAHFLESTRKLAEYFDEPLRSEIFDRENPGPEYALDQFLPTGSGDHFMGGRIQRRETSYPEEDMSPESIPSIMEALGLDSIVLLSNKMLNFGKLRGDEDRMVKIANAYVDYMLDHVVNPDQGIYSMIPVPYSDPTAAVDLLERVGSEEGLVSAVLESAGPEPPLGNVRYDPIYDVCERIDLPVVFHAGGSSIDSFHVKGYDEFIETHTLGFLWSNMSQMTSIIVQGLPEKFPDLDIIFQESGLFWVPMMMYRLDSEYLKRQSEAPLLEKRPSEYMREFYYGTQPLENPDMDVFLEQVIEMIGGVDRLMYSTDYPHWDYDEPSVITDLSFLSEEEKQRVLAGTAAEVFGI